MGNCPSSPNYHSSLLECFEISWMLQYWCSFISWTMHILVKYWTWFQTLVSHWCIFSKLVEKCSVYAANRETPQNHSAKPVHISLSSAEILQNSHLINFVEVACRHQWMDSDNSLQWTVHKLHAVSQSFRLARSPFL